MHFYLLTTETRTRPPRLSESDGGQGAQKKVKLEPRSTRRARRQRSLRQPATWRASR